MRRLLLALALLATPAAAIDGPVFKGFGTYTATEHDVVIPRGTVLRHVYDVTAATPGKRNPGFETAARFINSHVGNGMAERDVAVAVVVHGPAIAELTRPEVYAARNAGPANAMGVKKADLLPGVELAISASSAHAILQAQGYTLNPF